MAKKSKIARNEQRKLVVARYADKRAALKKALVDPNSTDEQREEAPRTAEASTQRITGSRPRPRCNRWSPTWLPRKVRCFTCSLPRHGSQGRATRHHQELLVST